MHEKQLIDFETGEAKFVNDGFTQLYNDKLSHLMELSSNPSAMKLFLWLIKHMDKRNAIVVSQDALSEALNLSRMTIHRAVAVLKEKKILAVLKSGGSNIYAINTEIAWKDNANGKKYAYFTAQVYVVESEQEPIFKTNLIGHAVKKEKKRKSVRELVSIEAESSN
jgi:hypothetical protein